MAEIEWITRTVGNTYHRECYIGVQVVHQVPFLWRRYPPGVMSRLSYLSPCCASPLQDSYLNDEAHCKRCDQAWPVRNGRTATRLDTTPLSEDIRADRDHIEEWLEQSWGLGVLETEIVVSELAQTRLFNTYDLRHLYPDVAVLDECPDTLNTYLAELRRGRDICRT